MFNEEKKRYKLYKSGKMWVAAPILFLGITLGTTSITKADQVQSHSISQSTSIQQKQISSVSTNNQKNTVTLSSKATNSSSQINSNSSSQIKDQSNQNQEHQTVTNFAAAPAKNEQNQQVSKQNTGISVSQSQLKQAVVQKPENQSQPDQQSKEQNQIVQSSQKSSQSSLDKYVFAENHPNAKQVNQNNNWYLQENGKNLTGFGGGLTIGSQIIKL